MTRGHVARLTLGRGNSGGKKEFTFGNEHMVTRTMEGEYAKFACIALSAHPRAVCPTNAFFKFFMWSKVVVSMTTFKARLQGAEQVTLGKTTFEHPNHGERKCSPCRVLTQLANNHQNSCVRDAVVERVTRMHGQILDNRFLMLHSNFNVSKNVLTQNTAAQMGMFCGVGEIRGGLEVDRYDDLFPTPSRRLVKHFESTKKTSLALSYQQAQATRGVFVNL